MNRVVIVSNMVDGSIRDKQPDTKYYIFEKLSDLDSFISKEPIRAEELYFTKDTMSLVYSNLPFLLTLMERPFLRVDKLVYITEKNSDDIKSVKYICDQAKRPIEILEVNYTKERIMSMITGSGRSDKDRLKKMSVYRVPTQKFLQDQMHQSNQDLEEEYLDDNKQLSNLPNETYINDKYSEVESVCEIFDIIGSDKHSRSLFTLLSAQYLSYSGKVLILESDIQFHKLTELYTKAEIPALFIEVKEVIHNHESAIAKIRNTQQKLIVIGSIDRDEYSYSFLFNLLYCNLKGDLDYMIRETDFDMAPMSKYYCCVIQNDVCSLLEAVTKMSSTINANVSMVSMDYFSYFESNFMSPQQIKDIYKDTTSYDLREAVILRINSFTIQQGVGYNLLKLLKGDI